MILSVRVTVCLIIEFYSSDLDQLAVSHITVLVLNSDVVVNLNGPVHEMTGGLVDARLAVEMDGLLMNGD